MKSHCSLGTGKEQYGDKKGGIDPCTEGSDLVGRLKHAETILGATPIFKPGGIPAPEVREFWKSELKAGDWVMNVIKNGYVLPLNEQPERYEEQNN